MPARAITASAPPTAAPVSAALDVLSDAFEDVAAAAEVLPASALDEETSFFDVSAFELEASDFESAFEASVFDSPPSADTTPKSSVIESVPPLKAPSFSQPATSGQAFFVTSPVSSLTSSVGLICILIPPSGSSSNEVIELIESKTVVVPSSATNFASDILTSTG